MWCVRDDGLDYVENSGPAGILWDLPLNKYTVVAKIKIKKKTEIVDLFRHVLAYTNIKPRGAQPRPCS